MCSSSQPPGRVVETPIVARNVHQVCLLYPHVDAPLVVGSLIVGHVAQIVQPLALDDSGSSPIRLLLRDRDDQS